MLFCGEATSNTGYGTVHGAFQVQYSSPGLFDMVQFTWLLGMIYFWGLSGMTKEP